VSVLPPLLPPSPVLRSQRPPSLFPPYILSPHPYSIIPLVVSLFLDSGVRRGTDVLKAMALGATAVLLGKPIFFGLAVGGEEGVRRVVEILRRETEVAMILCGCSDLGKVGRGLVREGGRGSYIRPSRL